MGYGPLLSLTFLARARQDTSEVAETLLASRASVNAAAQPRQEAWYLCSAARAHAALFGATATAQVGTAARRGGQLPGEEDAHLLAGAHTAGRRRLRGR